MTIKTTPRYGFQYIDDTEPLKNLPSVTENIAKRLETAMNDAAIPPGNPDLNNILARLDKLGRYCEVVSGERDASDMGMNFGPLRLDPGASIGRVFATPGTDGKIQITEAGVYVITYMIYPRSAPGNVHLWGSLNGAHLINHGQITYGSWEHIATAVTSITPGGVLQFGSATANPVKITARINIAKVG